MSVFYDLIRPLLFCLPPEAAHELTLRGLRPWERFLQGRAAPPAADSLLAQRVWGLDFAHPLGLAAGFDKNGALPHVWSALGFAFAEIGTVTALAQPGNPRPRLFRLPAERGLINRLGFNNAGASAVAADLAARLAHVRPPGPLGVNIGKSKLTALERAADDYCASLRALFPLADYVVVNVSSPNTPGLRDLQAEEQLAPLLAALQEENRRLARAHAVPPRPVLVKVAPDLADQALAALVDTVRTHGIAGLIATNTTVERNALPAGHALAEQAGGLSGAPLRARATSVLRALYHHSAGQLPIIGVGGIGSGADAYERIRAGASLVQAYTGFVYGGPGFARRTIAELRALLQRDGFTNVAQAVGIDARAPA
ncbi:MAG: quinone-dependent dihydroorotate dehydrogenase [Candidatus Binatia bacterium]